MPIHPPYPQGTESWLQLSEETSIQLTMCNNIWGRLNKCFIKVKKPENDKTNYRLQNKCIPLKSVYSLVTQLRLDLTGHSLYPKQALKPSLMHQISTATETQLESGNAKHMVLVVQQQEPGERFWNCTKKGNYLLSSLKPSWLFVDYWP